MNGYRNRIAGLEYVDAAELVAHEKNWRRHPENQTSALRGILNEVGIADALIAYRSERNGDKLTILDGHLRRQAAPQQWPVLVLDVTDEEADKLLATIDPLAAMAQTDEDALAVLLQGIEAEDEALQAMLDHMAQEIGLSVNGAEGDADAEPQIDRAEELREQWGVSTGQIWGMGKHTICPKCGKRHDLGA